MRKRFHRILLRRILLIFVLAVVECAGFRGLTAPSAASMASPSVTHARQDLSTADLLDLLLTEPFAEDVLPDGFDDPVVVPWEEGDTDLEGSLGGAIVHLSGEQEGGIGYVVFPDERGAERRLAEATDQALAESRGAVIDDFASVTVDEADYPARLLEFSDYVVCLVRVGPVIVFGQGGESLEPAARRDVAVALARAGVAHLVGLTAAIESPATPSATPPGTPMAARDDAAVKRASSVEAVPPRTLLDLLLSAPFPVDGLPEGIDQPIVQVWDEGDGNLVGAVGGVQVSDPDQLFPTVSYLVHPSAESAASAHQALVDEAAASGLTPSEVPDFDASAAVLDYGSLVVCQALVGNVIVFGLAGGEREADLVNAAILATMAGVRHLERLAADHATGIRPTYATGVLADVAPREFVARLLAAPFPDGGLPPGFANPTLVAWEDEVDADLIGTIGAAQVEFEDGAVGITFLVYPNEGAAELRLMQTADDAA